MKLTGALAHAPPVAAISMAGGGVARAAPATPKLESKVPLSDPARLESKVRHPMFPFVTPPPSGSPLHSEPDRLSVLSDPVDDEIK